MEEKIKYKIVVLALLAGFTLFCAGWYLARASAPAPYQVSVQRLPEDEDAEDVQPPKAGDARPDSLLQGEVIDINAADVYELQRLPGIGEKRAMDIIAWREEHGPFQTVEELTEVSGIGPVILENLREYAAAGSE